ncbi:MAG: cell division ATP-binding protein FtsE [Candidatus Marinimicrobia bacterium]|nr:cell division ATP-binding protein FtsE [Candidatus Neomarinimicrobiota bacterium]MCF7827704.1 cell division ATP-binding protein FtsE [Candidatus Neomarinimicrobiota bacterium]MCF7881241.1 cell division ATP-binding protein FtsE [Candidatus Neomarinimicrobiota bacterium]
MIYFYNVSKRFSRGSGVRDLNFSIHRGEFVCIVGPSGAGKSTVLKLIYMDEKPSSGKVVVDNFDSSMLQKDGVPYLRRRVGMVFQDFQLLHDRNVYDNVALALRVMRVRRRKIKKRVLQALNSVGIGHRAQYYPQELSGGEQQRVSIARAVVKEPIVLLADEPTGNLDPQVAREILALLRRINEKGTAVVMATHNYNLIKETPFRRIRLEEGAMVDQ